ncbi:secreted neurofilament-like protein [Phycomyces blakesleeanus NRRL 1555(-)]|uniref:Secreted neurofilament-like protein n=1 Tax=Phycomyces blakesleeanus (strain ATCC 8743b / DSM 1359 / FGSC 10004 / NBRC 33097 / NRRL 1555) TaxID=763407 RepID=A0A167MCP0_PHYB8|nr:secreted neurofilament-like protein [Phycomyces blakesleeanus NRRL 1555(-)]OAD72477.1 secreted neurofilament-like protein [Phycomyces blakesleeanus NRRL 1555(-)]|eukprot:XP_018290517.1 secreted neurofilament-like protein [Phycomyces blakesleeanus NRRL 1555(-)]
MNSKVYNALCAAFALAYLLAPDLLFIPVMLWEASPLPSAFCMAKPARKRRPSMMGVEPSGSLLSERHGGIPGHMSVNDSPSEDEDVVCVGKSNVFFGAELRGYIPHLLPLHKLESGIATMVFPVDGVAGTCGETHANLDEGVSSELVDICDEAEVSIRLRFICEDFFSGGFANPRLPARFFDTMLEEELNASENKGHCDSLTEVAEPECGLVPKLVEETFVFGQESVQTPLGLNNAGLNDPKPKFGTVQGLNEAFALSSWQSVNGFFWECLSTGLPTPMEIDDDLAWSEVMEVEGPMEMDDDDVEVVVPTAECGEEFMAHTYNPTVKDLQYVSQSANKDCYTSKIPACVPQQAADDKMDEDTKKIVLPGTSSQKKYDVPSPRRKEGADEVKGNREHPMAISRPKKECSMIPRPVSQKATNEGSKIKLASASCDRPSQQPKPVSGLRTERSRLLSNFIWEASGPATAASCNKGKAPNKEVKAQGQATTPAAKYSIPVAAPSSKEEQNVKAYESDLPAAPSSKKVKTSGSGAAKAEFKAPWQVTPPAAKPSTPVVAPSSKKEENVKAEESDLPAAPSSKRVKTMGGTKAYSDPIAASNSKEEKCSEAAELDLSSAPSSKKVKIMGDEKTNLVADPISEEIEQALIQPFPTRNPASKPAKSSSNRGKEDPKSLLKYVLRFKGDPTVNKEGVVKESAKLMIPKTWTNFCCPVRFTKRTSCLSVGPGAKPTRSESKVDPEAFGKLYGDTGIPRPFTVLFLGTICVGWLEPFVRRVLVDFLTGLRPRYVSGGFCTSRASGVLDSGLFWGHDGPVGWSGLVG